MDRNSKLWLAAILVMCLLLRLAFVFLFGDSEIRSDAAVFYQIACNIADGNGFSANTYLGETVPSAHGYVVYPYFLASLLYLFDAGFFGIEVAHAIIDTLCCLLVFCIARRFTGGGVQAGLFASFAFAVYPPFIFSVGTVMTETFNTLVMTALVFVLIVAVRRDWRYSALAGLFMGFAILSRPALLAFPLALALTLFFSRRQVSSWLPKAAVFVACSYLAISPWTARNYLLLKSFVPVTTNFGMPFWGGTGPADGVCLGGPGYPVDTKERNLYDHHLVPYVSEQTYQKITSLQKRLTKMNEVDRDNALKREAIKEIKEHPGRYITLMPKKCVRFWFNLWHDFPPSKASIVVAVVNMILLTMAALGWRQKTGDSALKWVAFSAAAYHTAIYSIIYSTVRFSYPIMPLVIIFAAAWLSGLLDKLYGKVERPAGADAA
ncbi:MAG: glycosyltransferase family 39 protein [Armatimonadetes bacterium]|nr:glycosyltransferase family 39 protein [Armatimonadota bacterium]